MLYTRMFMLPQNPLIRMFCLFTIEKVSKTLERSLLNIYFLIWRTERV